MVIPLRSVLGFPQLQESKNLIPVLELGPKVQKVSLLNRMILSEYKGSELSRRSDSLQKQVIATGIATWLVDKSGRRLLLIISSSVMTVSLLIVSVAFYLEGVVSEDSHLYSILGILSVVGLVVMVIGFSLGIGPIPWLIMSEILPVNIKGLAGSIATMGSWLFSWLITLTANLLLNWSSGGTFTIYTVVAAFTVAFTAIWVPETKGRTLEEIQFSFR